MSAANGISPGVGGGGGKMRRERTRVVASKPQEKEVRLHSLICILKYLNTLKFIIKSFDAVMRGHLEVPWKDEVRRDPAQELCAIETVP